MKSNWHSFSRRVILNLFFFFYFLPSFLLGQTFASNGMVVSDHYLASEVGVEILKKGGNAIDAAVATAFALAVTHPSAGNIGGGGFLVFMDTSGKATSIDFREKAPLAASIDMFLDENGQLIPGINHKGLLSVGVPGTVAGLYLAHQKYGRLPWSALVQPAVDLARNGFDMSWGLFWEASLVSRRDSSYDILVNFFRNQKGDVIQPGELWKQPALANTLETIRDRGHNGFYRGPVAEEIHRYMADNGGLITMEDLARYQAVERDVIHGTYRGYDVYSMPPPSSGGVALIEMLNLMEQVDPLDFDFGSSDYVHLLAEIMRRAYVDRAAWMGDPDVNPDMPVGRLTSKEYAAELFKTIRMTKASESDSLRITYLEEGDNTTHFSVLDAEGNAVSLTYTLEYSYGSGMGSEKLGFIFNNEMGDFNPVPGKTSANGLIGTLPNVIAPEKRMLSSMTPTIVAKDGKPFLIIGSPGGRTIINTVFQTVLAVLAYGMPLDEAIESLKIHHQWLPDVIRYEEHKLPIDVRANLEHKGHQLQKTKVLGRLMGILNLPDAGLITGHADSSSPDGAAVGY